MRLVRADSSRISGWIPRMAAGSLPAELVERTAARLCWVGMISAVTLVAVAVLEHWLQPEVFALQKTPLVWISSLAFLLLSASLVFVNRFGWFSARALVWIGAAYEVGGAFSLGVFEHSPPWPSHWPVRGTSLLSLWIVVIGLLVPNTPVRSLLAGIAAAAMGPLAYVTTRLVLDNPPLAGNRLAVWFFMPFLMAAWTALINSRLYRLEVDVSRARDMGSYQLEKLLGSGGMGEVWRARHRMLALSAAVKLIRPEVLALHAGRQADVIRRRFEREARATAALRSPHTVALYDFGVAEDGSFYYVMELLDGVNLERLVRRFGPQPPARVIHLLLQVCDSLAEAHQIGLVHRDIKPTNVFVCRLGLSVDFVKVLDFGLVKPISPDMDTRVTLDGTTTGTPAYMAPEVAIGDEEIDGRADIYAVGCVAYWLLTGQLVFEEPSPVAVALAHVQQPPIPPSERTELSIPASLESVVMSCLEKRPEDRPDTAAELASMLRQCIDDAGTWTPADAERWWQVNLPSAAVPAAGGGDQEADA